MISEQQRSEILSRIRLRSRVKTIAGRRYLDVRRRIDGHLRKGCSLVQLNRRNGRYGGWEAVVAHGGMRK